MSTVLPHIPSYVFGYWRPWNENSNLFNSYLDYVRDTSLVKYGADTVGKYINIASKAHMQNINELGQAIGRGMNILSNQMSDINETLFFLNRNIDIQIEQQKLSNLLLQNIVELLRVPNTEKYRQLCIEQGLKFFVNAEKDPDLYTDALEELIKAESLMKQDYFVLHRIGCIYLYAEKYINPEKAFDYFIKAAKYSIIESNPKAMRLANVLNQNYITSNSFMKMNSFDKFNDLNKENIFKVILKNAGNKLFDVIKIIKEHTKLNLKGAKDIVDNVPKTIIENISKGEAELISFKLKEVSADVEIIKSEEVNTSFEFNNIALLASDSYEKAAFCAYILGKFEDAVKYQTKALNLNSSVQNRFLLAKYQIRNSEISLGVKNLEQCIEAEPVFALASFKEIDLINEPEVLNLILIKNNKIDSEINNQIIEWKKVKSTQASNILEELNELTQKSYELKVTRLNSIKNKEKEINVNIDTLVQEIDSYIAFVRDILFCTYDDVARKEILNELLKSKDLKLEEMQNKFDAIFLKVESDRLKIGSIYAGGIVFFIDKTGKHGLVCAEKDFGKSIWGVGGEIGAKKNGIADGSGMSNTKIIVNQASWFIEKGFFSTSKKPIPTAARLCIESNHNDLNDWYLPTPQELKLMYENLKIHNIGNFQKNFYWSSYESSEEWASGFDFIKGEIHSFGSKQYEACIRAVRLF